MNRKNGALRDGKALTTYYSNVKKALGGAKFKFDDTGPRMIVKVTFRIRIFFYHQVVVRLVIRNNIVIDTQ